MYSFSGNCAAQSQFRHSCICGRFKYSQDWSTYFAATKKADWCWKYIFLSQIYEWRNWETEHYNSVFGNNEAAQLPFWEYINGNQTFTLDSHCPFICSDGTGQLTKGRPWQSHDTLAFHVRSSMTTCSRWTQSWPHAGGCPLCSGGGPRVSTPSPHTASGKK